MRFARSFAWSFLPFAALLVAAGYSPTAPAPAVAAFTQGIITTKVSLPGNPYDKYLSKLDPAKGNLQAQMQQLAAGLTPAEQQKFQAEAAKLSPAMTIGALMLPRKGTIYCRGQEARATTDALTYHLENYFNNATNKGLLLLSSQSTPQTVNYTYDAASVKKTWQTIVVTAQDYTSKTGPETALVAGYLSKKTVYTLKPGAAATTTEPGQISDKPVALDVWTSAQIPQSLNFAHPVYVAEAHGITRLVVYFDKERKQQLVYEFASVQPKAITDQDLKIKTTAPVLDYAKDEMQVAMKTLALMMGGGPQPAGSDD
ncbi:hypothetical protein [Hymenobacter psychrotolerans]|uniref:Uncharacterized protein n=1 Tax=Hymenobacter psychrotolerans DSM 18569 TaxID=1121959 RepID=A0A1M6SNC7_9BACT|nr:hypothetical protein [Hymenobacter psychrotolerans]SHK46205.1 hypothetical protein SAMN02746009_00928 [Hymenobacter psychrotolerans DSM 18569]